MSSYVCAEWHVGLSENDDDIMRPVLIDVGQILEMKQGYLWIDNNNTGIMLGTLDVIADVTLIELPGHLWMEPGICIVNSVQVLNKAYLKTLIKTYPICVKSKNTF
jgi:hypothetical protein